MNDFDFGGFGGMGENGGKSATSAKFNFILIGVKVELVIVVSV